MNRCTLFALSAAVFVSAFAVPASAGERTVLSALPSLPAAKDAETPPPALGVPGLKVELRSGKPASYIEMTAAKAQGYCIVQRDESFSLQDSVAGEANELWHFVEKDDKATLERIRFQLATDNAWVKSKTTLELHALARDAGVTVWGMKDTDGSVIVLAKGGTSGREAMGKKEDFGIFTFMSSSCSFGATRVNTAAIARGAAVQLSGDYPPEGEGKAKTIPRFIIDVSAAKLSRDPEPVLSVRVRRVEH